MSLNIFQRAAARTFAQSRYAHIAKMATASPAASDAEIIQAIRDTNDPAFEDAMRALASPSVTTTEDALAVLHAVRSSEDVFDRDLDLEEPGMGMAA